MLDEQNREPVSTYGHAVSWLFKHSDVAEWAFDPDATLPAEARLVCDMFWINQRKLVADIRKLWDEAAGPCPVVPSFRRANRTGWR